MPRRSILSAAERESRLACIECLFERGKALLCVRCEERLPAGRGGVPGWLWEPGVFDSCGHLAQ